MSNIATPQDVLAAELYFRAAFPAMKIPLTEDPAQAAKFEKINAVIEFKAADDEHPLACHIVFLTEQKAAELTEKALQENPEAKPVPRFKVYQGEYDSRYEGVQVVTLAFKSIKSLLGVFKGNSPVEMLGIVAPLLKNIFKKATLPFLFLMLSLTKMMPNFNPGTDQPWEQYLKVKMSLYMITTALSQANKLGWEPLSNWMAKQTDRIYQFKVGATLDANGKEIYPPIAAYLRVKAGKSKAGRGEYTRKRPFVLFDFPNPDGCLAVLSGRYEFVEAATKGCITVVGAGDSYAVQFNNLMTQLQNMLIPSKFVK